MHSSPPLLTENAWFMTYGDGRAGGRRIVAFPHGGAGAGAFRVMASHLPPDVVLTVLVAPGRERRFREVGFTSVEPLIDAFLPALMALFDRDIAFLGHSVGALIAFECCRRLQRLGHPSPSLLAVSARVAPQAERRMGDFHDLPTEHLIEAVKALHAGSFATPPDPAFVRAMEMPLRRDFEITDRYRYREGPPLSVPILATGSADDPSTFPEDLDGWAWQTSARFIRHVFPDGGHFFLDRHGAALLDLLDAAWPKPGDA